MIRTLVLISLILSLFVGCETKTVPTENSSGVFTVATTFYPVTYFAKRIAGTEIDVQCYLAPGEDPIFWKPERATILKYQNADLILVNGANFEKWVKGTSLPNKKLVNTSRTFKDEWIRYEEAVTHSHGSGGEHSHEGIDGHTWVSPAFAILQAESILKAYVKKLPAKKAVFEKNFNALKKDLESLDNHLKEIAKKAKGKWFAASHPAYNYLKLSYEFNIQNFDFDPEAVPDEKDIAGLIKTVQEKSISYMLWESEPTQEVATFFEEKAKVKSVVFSPAENPDEETLKTKDFLAIMKENLKQFEEIVSK